MAKPALISLIKPIEATKLNPRTGMSLGLPDATVPYGALIEYVGPDRDRERFRYLSELYGCKREAFLSATAGAKLDQGAVEEEEVTPVSASEQAAPTAEMPENPREVLLQWEELKSSNFSVLRTAIPGGWLVTVNGSSVAFVPDARHQWDGGSVE